MGYKDWSNVTKKKNSLRNQLALARNIDNHLPEVIVLRAFQQMKGFKLTDSTTKLSNEDEIVSESISDDCSLQDSNMSLKSISVIRRELPEANLGWPLLQKNGVLSRVDSRRSRARSMSLVEWVMSLPSRSSEMITESQVDSGSDEFDRETQSCSSAGEMFKSCENGSIEESEADDQSMESTSNSQVDFPHEEEEEGIGVPEKLKNRVEIELKLKSSACKQFSYKELERATNRFSAENLIGEGGCSRVYLGRLCWGKQVALKVLKHYDEVWSDFSLEVEIMSSLKHKNITHLIGMCIEGNHLILVYDFLPKGSLEDILQGQNEKFILPWKVRFKLAISVAEALNYLHNECSPPVIHRDVKSSNILLSNDLEPQLSDFGLAIWGPVNSQYRMCNDIVGTFGYIAPEYFMDGRVSDKIDLYSFGVVLLELLSGSKPICSTGQKGQESLVKWAMPLLSSGNLESLLDPQLGDEFDVVQMQRMVLAATLCIKQSPRLRPNASQILELLGGEVQVQKWMHNYINYLIESSREEFSGISTEYFQKLISDSSFLGLNDRISSPGSRNKPERTTEKRQHLRLKDYLQEQQD